MTGVQTCALPICLYLSTYTIQPMHFERNWHFSSITGSDDETTNRTCLASPRGAYCQKKGTTRQPTNYWNWAKVLTKQQSTGTGHRLSMPCCPFTRPPSILPNSRPSQPSSGLQSPPTFGSLISSEGSKSAPPAYFRPWIWI